MIFFSTFISRHSKLPGCQLFLLDFLDSLPSLVWQVFILSSQFYKIAVRQFKGYLYLSNKIRFKLDPRFLRSMMQRFRSNLNKYGRVECFTTCEIMIPCIPFQSVQYLENGPIAISYWQERPARQRIGLKWALLSISCINKIECPFQRGVA
jgi:hypothetical protein